MGWVGVNTAYQKFREEAREDTKREEEIALARENSLFELALANTKASSKYKKTGDYEKAAAASRSLELQLKELDNLDEETLNFYKPILEDPLAAAELQDFIKSQNEQGINVALTDVPNLVTIVTSKAPVTEKVDYLELITGKDFSGDEGKKLYRDLAMQISSMTSVPGRTAFVVPGQGTQIDRTQQTKRQDEMLAIISAQIVPMAKRFVSNNPDTENQKVRDIQAAIDKVLKGDKDDRRIGLQTLMDEYLDATLLKDLVELFPDKFRDYQKNPYIPINITSMPLEL
tara:strand:+ start:251 stop:1108 length:858 start_codon:yes stop_codon:yes gene_type:complete